MRATPTHQPHPHQTPLPCTLWTRHAKQRAASRSIPIDAVDLVLTYGRTAYVRGAAVHVIGRKEVQRARELGVNATRCQGIHVVCDSSGGPIITVYRNPHLRGLRPRRRHHHARSARW